MVELSALITDLGTIVTLMVTTMTSFLDLFCQPPLVIFIGIAVAAIAFAMVRRALHR